jgi:uncharacterized membrane protein YfcA
MLLPDLINGIFESCGGLFIALSVIKLHHEKIVRGVSWMHVTFFSAWGFWNLYFYPHLDQWMSFWGGLLLVAVNTVWLGQIMYYNRRTYMRMPPSERTERYRWSDK